MSEYVRPFTKREWVLAPLGLALAMFVVYKAFASDIDEPAMRAAVREECPPAQHARVLRAYEDWLTREPGGNRLLVVACGGDLEHEALSRLSTGQLSARREVARMCRGPGRKLEQDRREFLVRRRHVFMLVHCT